jgi:flagellar protein FliJ
LDVKKQLETQKKLEYSISLTALRDSELKKKLLEDDISDQIESFKQNINNTIDGNVFRYFNDYIELLKKKSIEQDKIILDNKIKAESKRQELVEAMKQSKMMNKLKDNDLSEFYKSEQQKEYKVIDEIVSYKHNRR